MDAGTIKLIFTCIAGLIAFGLFCAVCFYACVFYIFKKNVSGFFKGFFK